MLSLVPDTKSYDIKEVFSRRALGKCTHILDILHICEYYRNILMIFSKQIITVLTVFILFSIITLKRMCDLVLYFVFFIFIAS